MNKKILVLGITGTLGHVLFDYLMHTSIFDVYGSTRKLAAEHEKFKDHIFDNIEIIKGESEKLKDILMTLKPDIILNCIGLIKQQKIAGSEELSIDINTLFPKFLYEMSMNIGSRLLHISTDCIFDGERGNYLENDIPNAKDIYGITKRDGEIKDNQNVLVIRTSFIGHEMHTHLSLLDWFLSQEKEVFGYHKAYFSGTTAFELSKILAKYIIPNEKLFGVYHVGAERISKYNLLGIVKNIYGKNITIKKNIDFQIDRSLNQEKFLKQSGYKHKSWAILIQEQYCHYQEMILRGYYAKQ